MIKLALSTSWAERVQPVRLTMTEAISRCYTATLDVLSDEDDLDLAGALRRVATVTVEGFDGDRTITGIVFEMSFMGRLPGDSFWYRLVLVPKLRLLELTLRSRVFCTERPATVAAMFQQILDSAEGVSWTGRGLVDKMSQTAYPQHDMIVQYEETDLAFLSRLAENSGIFYVFTGDKTGEQVVFGDDNNAFPSLSLDDGDTLSYRPRVAISDGGSAIRSVTLHTRLRPADAMLDERDYAQPQMALSVRSRPQQDGLGSHAWQEADGYRDSEWGNALANIRAQEAAVDRVVLEGESDCAALAAGSAFQLQGHSAAVDGKYVATSVEHLAWQSAPGIEHLPGPPRTGTGYLNSFIAIPAGTPYRPHRITPWPRLPGVIRATIDGADTGRADVDQLGCYRIILPFDHQARPPGKSSSPVRLISPYGGPKEGLHFPLLPGTQVMIAFHNGDPDRPMIVGALYDAVQTSVVTDANRYRNVIRTSSGITVTMNDGPPPR
ncbi:type VI secretion system Vgr family protein [Inquilinus sp. CA228]|uniref:type VI secretion system Vgr family protein n=1 Tax=Inquilinus sp. CA228 TaxID=3455609 RepID=UPI003F8D6FA6